MYKVVCMSLVSVRCEQNLQSAQYKSRQMASSTNKNEHWAVNGAHEDSRCQLSVSVSVCVWAVVEWTGRLRKPMLEGQALRLTPHPMRFEMLMMCVQFGHVCCASWTDWQQHGTHASGKKLHTEYEYTSTCIRRFLYSYSSTALTISGCGQWEAAGRYDTSYKLRESTHMQRSATTAIHVHTPVL